MEGASTKEGGGEGEGEKSVVRRRRDVSVYMQK